MHAPLQPANLLFVSKKLILIAFLCSDISNEDGTISATSSYQISIPRACSNSIKMALERSDLLALVHVPNGSVSVPVADAQMATPLRPCHRCDLIIDALEFAQLLHTGVKGVPNVDARAESHRQHVGLGPVDKVEVEVITQGGGIKHFVGFLWDLATERCEGVKRREGIGVLGVQVQEVRCEWVLAILLILRHECRTIPLLCVLLKLKNLS